MPDFGAIAQAVSELFDFEVGVGVTDPRGPQPDLMQGEGAHLARAVPARKLEFAAGRAAARQAMAAIAHAAAPVMVSHNRSPIWPIGLHGTISHSQGLCVAVVTTTRHSIGIDIEEATPLDPSLLREIVPNQTMSLNGPKALRLAKLIFCAKEAAFKAQYPLSQQLFGFDHMDIDFENPSNRFAASFAKSVGPFAAGDLLLGRHAVLADHFVTAVSVDVDDFEGR